MLGRTFELRCRKLAEFSSLLYFLAEFEILGQSCRCFWSLSLASSLFFAIVIRRLLYVPYYVAGSLNSSFIWSLSLQLFFIIIIIIIIIIIEKYHYI